MTPLRAVHATFSGASQQHREGLGAAIIYCNSRWEVDEAARELKSRGWRAEGYHAGRLQPERQRVQVIAV